MIDATLGRLSAGESLSMDEMAQAVESIMRGEWEDPQIGILLTALSNKGETVAEVAGAALALRRTMVPISSRHEKLLDTCGTGGDASGTFNISTAAAIVTSAAGVPVAKHGNRAITSKTGSADVLSELGIHIDADAERVTKCLDELGICFCFAPRMHPSMRRVAQVRKQLGFPTIFNLLGPLCNPAGAEFQLLGVGKAHLRSLLADALAMLQTQRACIVHGEDGLDEVTLAGVTHVSLVTNGTVTEFSWKPEEFGLVTAPLDSMYVDGPVQSAALIREILYGAKGPARDVVVLNAAAALYVANAAADPMACARLAGEALDDGAAKDLLAQLAQRSHA